MIILFSTGKLGEVANKYNLSPEEKGAILRGQPVKRGDETRIHYAEHDGVLYVLTASGMDIRRFKAMTVFRRLLGRMPQYVLNPNGVVVAPYKRVGKVQLVKFRDFVNSDLKKLPEKNIGLQILFGMPYITILDDFGRIIDRTKLTWVIEKYEDLTQYEVEYPEKSIGETYVIYKIKPTNIRIRKLDVEPVTMQIDGLELKKVKIHLSVQFFGYTLTAETIESPDRILDEIMNHFYRRSGILTALDEENGYGEVHTVVETEYAPKVRKVAAHALSVNNEVVKKVIRKVLDVVEEEIDSHFGGRVDYFYPADAKEIIKRTKEFLNHLNYEERVTDYCGCDFEHFVKEIVYKKIKESPEVALSHKLSKECLEHVGISREDMRGIIGVMKGDNESLRRHAEYEFDRYINCLIGKELRF